MRMPSRMARLARPVRTLASSRLSLSIALPMLPSRSETTSLTMVCLLAVDERADRLAHHHPADVAALPQVEHHDRQPVVSAQRDGRRVHHGQIALEHVEVAEALEL